MIWVENLVSIDKVKVLRIIIIIRVISPNEDERELALRLQNVEEMNLHIHRDHDRPESKQSRLGVYLHLGGQVMGILEVTMKHNRCRFKRGFHQGHLLHIDGENFLLRIPEEKDIRHPTEYKIDNPPDLVHQAPIETAASRRRTRIRNHGGRKSREIETETSIKNLVSGNMISGNLFTMVMDLHHQAVVD